MNPRGWHLDIRTTTAALAVVVGCIASLIVVLAGPAGQAPDSGAAILSGLLAAVAVLLRNTSDAIPASTPAPVVPAPPPSTSA